MDHDRFTQLINALETGWEIEEPVMLGQMWHTDIKNGNGTYHFVLHNRNQDRKTLISLPPSPQLLVFLHENKLNVSAMPS